MVPHPLFVLGLKCRWTSLKSDKIPQYVYQKDKARQFDLTRVDRDKRSQYSSPIIWKNSVRNELILGGMVYRSYEPATGNLLWQLDLNKGRSSATPIAFGDRLYIGNELRNRGGADDGGGRLFRIRPGGSGDITPSNEKETGEHVEWRTDDSEIQMVSRTMIRPEDDPYSH